MIGETWKPEVGLRWKIKSVVQPEETLIRVLEQIWICVETGHLEWREVPEIWNEPTSVIDPVSSGGE